MIHETELVHSISHSQVLTSGFSYTDDALIKWVEFMLTHRLSRSNFLFKII